MKSLIFVLALFLSSACIAKNNKGKIKTDILFNNGEDVIWSLEFHPIKNNLLFFTERSGKLKSIDLNTKSVTTYLGLPSIFSGGQGGLLDLAFDKDGTLYFTYSENLKNGYNTTSLFKGTIDFVRNQIIGKNLYQTNALSTGGYHFGSRIVLTENEIYFSVGERNDRDKSQDLNYEHGKILRLNKDGSIPKDNPFISNSNARKAIYSLGHRNPQGLIMDNQKNLYNSEFGPRGGDEINKVLPSKNYGWPVITYGKEYWGPSIGNKEKEGMEQPIVYWTPSISPSGIDFYYGDKFSKLKGNLLIANLSGQHLRRLVLKEDKVVEQVDYLSDLDERFRDIKTSVDGYIYLATDSGKIIKVNEIE